MNALICVYRATGGTTSTIADGAAEAAAAEAHKAQAEARLSSRELANQMSAHTPPSNARARASSQTPDALKALERRQASRNPEQQAAGAPPMEAAWARQTSSETPEAEQAGEKPSAVKQLWGAAVGQRREPAVQAAVLPRTETLIAAEDRQKHRSVLPQVGTEWNLSD